MGKSQIIPEIAEIIYGDDNVLQMNMQYKSTINLDAAKKITEVASELAGDTIHCNLVDIRKMTFMSNDARNHFGSQSKSTVKAVAIVMNAKLHRPLVNLYLKLSRPSLPTKMFDDWDRAKEWLLEKLKD